MDPPKMGTSPPATPATDAGTTVVRGASLLIILQVVSRAVTFIANQLLLRYLTAQLLGVATQLEVYYLSVLFFARESLRVAVQRQAAPATVSSQTKKRDDDGPVAANRRASQESQSVVNLGYLALLLGVFVSLSLGWTYLAYASETTLRVPNMVLSLRLYGLAAILELLSEPCFVLMQTRLMFGVRATAESTATFSRCVATFVSAVWASRRSVDLGVLPFAVGQLAYGVVLLSIYLWYGLSLASKDGFSILPRSIRGIGSTTDYLWSCFYRPTISLASSMMAQSIVKHILTQGDTFLVSILSTPTAQGVYALANNYGGLLARLVFQPIEESSRSYFSRLLSGDHPTQEGDGKTSRTQKDAAQKASRDLHNLLKVYILLSTIIVAVGPVASPSLLSVLAGRRWMMEGAGEALATYCYYVPLLAVNGVAEAFVASVATEAEVHQQSAWMAAFSLAFGAAGFVFLRVMGLGAVGLVYANGINMLCRIAWSSRFIQQYFSKTGTSFDVLSLRPHLVTTLACLATPHMVQRLVLASSPSDANAFILLIKIAVAALPSILLM
jgi:oligosaccharide translocation protein RFT1